MYLSLSRHYFLLHFPHPPSRALTHPAGPSPTQQGSVLSWSWWLLAQGSLALNTSSRVQQWGSCVLREPASSLPPRGLQTPTALATQDPGGQARVEGLSTAEESSLHQGTWPRAGDRNSFSLKFSRQESPPGAIWGRGAVVDSIHSVQLSAKLLWKHSSERPPGVEVKALSPTLEREASRGQALHTWQLQEPWPRGAGAAQCSQRTGARAVEGSAESATATQQPWWVSVSASSHLCPSLPSLCYNWEIFKCVYSRYQTWYFSRNFIFFIAVEYSPDKVHSLVMFKCTAEPHQLCSIGPSPSCFHPNVARTWLGLSD